MLPFPKKMTPSYFKAKFPNSRSGEISPYRSISVLKNEIRMVDLLLECHHFAIPNEITDAGNDYQWLKANKELNSGWLLDCHRQS